MPTPAKNSGNAQSAKASIATRVHPARDRWVERQGLERATYVATNEAMGPYLIPHDLESNTIAPQDLRRAKLGHVPPLNYSYLSEILGHAYGAAVNVHWGPLSTDGKAISVAPKDGVALEIWKDATLQGDSFSKFGNKVLEWMASSPGCWIITDSTSQPVADAADDDEDRGPKSTAKGQQTSSGRPYMRIVQWSSVEDLGQYSDGRLRFIKFHESVDERDPESAVDSGMTNLHVLYRLQPDGTVTVRKLNDDGADVVPATSLGTFIDAAGRPVIPIAQAKFGEDELLPFLGSGLLQGLAFVVKDLWNQVTEMRSGARDVCFDVLAYKGASFESVKTQMAAGDRLIDLGASELSSLTRVGADGGEIGVALTIFKQTLEDWAMGAKRKASDFVTKGNGTARSGVSLQAEFQLDLKPLLVALVSAWSDAMRAVLFFAAQFANDQSGLDKLGVITVNVDQEFSLEDEAARISRIVTDYDTTGLPMIPEAQRQLMLTWAKSTRVVDLNARVKDPADPTQKITAGDLIERQADEMAARADAAGKAPTPAPGTPGAPGVVPPVVKPGVAPPPPTPSAPNADIEDLKA